MQHMKSDKDLYCITLQTLLKKKKSLVCSLAYFNRIRGIEEECLCLRGGDQRKDGKHEAMSPAGTAYYTVVNFYFAFYLSFLYFSKLRNTSIFNYL